MIQKEILENILLSLQRFEHINGQIKTMQKDLCLDSRLESARGLTLQDCDAALPSQKWLLLDAPQLESVRNRDI